MALTLVGTQSAAATTVTVPAHQKGDLLVFFAYRSGSTTAATRPVGIADVGPTSTKSGTTQSLRLGYKVATGTSDTSGTWTNATELTVHVLRPDPGFTALPGQVAFSSSTTTTITFPALTLGDTSGLSWVLGFVGCSNLTQTIGTAPTGMTNRQLIAGASHQAASDDTNGGVSSWSVQTITAGAGNSVSATLEILCLPQTISLVNIFGHIAGGSNPFARGNTTVSPFQYVCPVSTKSGTGTGGGLGNTILFAITYDGGATVSSVVGAINGSFGSPVKTALGGAGNLDTAVYMLQNIAAGQEVITVTFSGATTAFTYAVTELYNVALSGGVSGSSSTALSTTLAAGSFTPTNNNANGGNFIWCYFSKADQIPNSSSSHFLPGTGFTLLSADCNYSGSYAINPANGLTKCVQYQVQGTSAAINPSFSSLNETGDHWNCIAISLPINNSAGSPIPAGQSATRISHFASESFPTTGSPLFKMQLPVNGNFRLLCCDDPSMNTQIITDSEGNTWTNAVASNGGQPGFWYLANAQANPNLIVYANGGGSDNELSFRFFDIIGADPSPSISCVSSGQTLNGLSSFTMSPAPTPPTASTGVTYVNVGLGQGPGLAVTSPSGAIWDLCTYSGETDLDEMENADIMAHGSFSVAGAQVWTFTITNQVSNSTSGGAITVSGAPPPTHWQQSIRGPGRSPGIAPQSARFYQPQRNFSTVTVTNVTVALTGQTATFTAGTLIPNSALAINGQSASFTAGTLTANNAVALTANTATFTAGSMVISSSLAISGLTATFSSGTLLPSISLTLSGQTATFAAGTLSPSGDVTVSISGLTGTFTAGSLSPAIALPITASSATFSAGTLAPSISLAVNGLAATFTAGTFVIPGDVTVAITGLTATFTAGQFSIAPSASQDAGSRRYRFIYRITIDGVVFGCATYQEAIALLNRAKEAARKLAEDRAIWTIKSLGPSAKIEPPRITVSSRELRSAAAKTKREIVEIYANEIELAEFRMYFEIAQRNQDDDETITWLM